MTSNIKRIVGEALASYLSDNVVGLTGKVSSAQEGPETNQTFPSVALLMSTFSFNPSDYDEVYWDEDTDDGKLVLDVGEFDGLMTLELYTKSKPERELYEQRILDLFLSQPGSPGTLFITLPVLTINGYASLYQPEIKVRLTGEEWQEEMSFEARRYTFLDLEIGFPALTTRDAVTIETLQSAITNDLDSDTPTDTVTIEEDGSVS